MKFNLTVHYIRQITQSGESAQLYLYLGDADLRGADLGGADLRGAYLRGAYLGGAYLGGAYLRGAYLRGADLGGAYLGGADLGGADLGGAYLGGAYLGGAYLRGADLGGAYLGGAYLGGKIPSTDLSAFSRWAEDPDFCIGYRTRNSPHQGGPGYDYDVEYIAPWFNPCPDRACAPGLYIGPTADAVYSAYPHSRIIRVVFLPGEALKAGDKYRCKRFYVLPEI